MATKLPSGKYRAQVFTGHKDGKRVYESFIAETADEADFAALEYKIKHKKNSPAESMTLGEAMERYIDSKSAILSPTTVREYNQAKRNSFVDIQELPLRKLDQDLVQRSVNDYALGHSPKSVRNAYGFLTAVLRVYYPSLVLNTSLPQRVKPRIKIPSDSEVSRLVKSVADAKMEIPVLLAAFVGLRRSEVCGIKKSDIDLLAGRIGVERAKVLDAAREWVVKGTKTTAGKRFVEPPQYVLDRLRAHMVALEPEDFIVSNNPEFITKQMPKICDKAAIPRYTYHELRHYYASKLHALNVPDQYAKGLMGHSSTYMLQNVYQHLLEEKEREVQEAVKAGLDDVLQHDMQHDIKKKYRISRVFRPLQ